MENCRLVVKVELKISSSLKVVAKMKSTPKIWPFPVCFDAFLPEIDHSMAALPIGPQGSFLCFWNQRYLNPPPSTLYLLVAWL